MMDRDELLRLQADRNTGRHAAELGGLAFILFIGLAIAWWELGSLERKTADATVEHGELWLYASDVAPGESIEGRVRMRGGARLAITGVTVRGFDAEGTPYQVLDLPVPWTGEIQVTTRTYGSATLVAHDGEDEATFRVPVPREAEAGRTLALELEVTSVVATTPPFGGGFENEVRIANFYVNVPVWSHGASVARRTGKGLGALAAVAGVLVLTVVVRRRRLPWPVALLIGAFLALGWIAVAILGGHAVRLHGGWWWAACIGLWLAAVSVALWWTRGDHLGRYRLIPRRIAGAPGDAYRAGPAELPRRTLTDVEDAWRAAGFAVYRKDGEVAVFGKGAEARVRIAGEEVGGGEPLEVRCETLEMVEELAAALAGVLGEVTIELAVARKSSREPDATGTRSA